MTDLLGAGLEMDAGWVWLLLLLPTTWAARFAYRKTRPIVPPARLIVLWSLRAAVFAVLVLLLAEPLLSYLTRRALRPVVVTLIDSSPSMDVETGGVTRLERFGLAMDDGLSEVLRGPAQAFSSTTHDIDLDTLSNLQTGGQASDLSAALHSAFSSVPDARLRAGVVLISDGRHNIGDDPAAFAAEQRTPIHVLGVGSDANPDDIQITSVSSDGMPVSARPISVRVQLRSWGFTDSSAILRLTEGDSVLVEATVRLEADGLRHVVELSLPPMEAGPHLLQAQVTPREGELTTHNNQSLLALRVRQDRLRVLLMASRPGPEVAFVARTLAVDSTLQVDKLIQRNDIAHYLPSSDDPSTYDAVLLLGDCRDGDLPLAPLPDIVAAGAGLLLQCPAALLRELPPDWVAMLPLMPDPSSIEVQDDYPLRLERDSRLYPIYRGLLARETTDPWQHLPPLLTRSTHMRAKPAGTVMLVSHDGDAVAAVATYGAGRVVQLAGSGFWRQAIFGAGSSNDVGTVPAFWQNAVRWLAVAEPGGQLRASAERPVFRSGQPAAIRAEVFDEFNSPLEGATVELILQPGGRVVPLDAQGSGQYRSEIRGLPVGTHTFSVQAHEGSNPIGTTEGSFVVESHTVESSDLRSDPEMLAAIARASGGQYRPLEDWRQLLPVLQPTPTLVAHEQRLGIEIRHVGWFILLALLLTAEWLLRKRSGML